MLHTRHKHCGYTRSTRVERERLTRIFVLKIEQIIMLSLVTVKCIAIRETALNLSVQFHRELVNATEDDRQHVRLGHGYEDL